ncbi:hypothetical protein QWU86_11750, partial [Neisseria gonorrhoeae]
GISWSAYRYARDFFHVAFASSKIHDCVRNHNLRAEFTTRDDLSFLPSRVTRVGVGGERSFDPIDMRRLVEARQQPGATLAGLA